MMNKKDMIETLQAQYESWQSVYNLFNSKITDDNQTPSVHGWYHSFDGPSINEMYLMNVHPCSDELAEVICINDFPVYKSEG